MSASEYLNHRESNQQQKATAPSERNVRESFNKLQNQLNDLRRSPSREARQDYDKAAAEHGELRDRWLKSHSRARKDMTKSLNTRYGLDDKQMKKLEEQLKYSRENYRNLSAKEQEELTVLADACENANYHTPSTKLFGTVGLSKAVQNPNKPVEQAWSIVYVYGDNLQADIKERIIAQSPEVWDRAMNTRNQRRELGLE